MEIFRCSNTFGQGVYCNECLGFLVKLCRLSNHRRPGASALRSFDPRLYDPGQDPFQDRDQIVDTFRN